MALARVNVTASRPAKATARVTVVSRADGGPCGPMRVSFGCGLASGSDFGSSERAVLTPAGESVRAW